MKALKPCGTPAAYSRHLYHREEPCDACSEASRAQVERYNEARRQLKFLLPAEFAALRAKEEPTMRGWHQAISALAREHKDLFDAILAEIKAGAS